MKKKQVWSMILAAAVGAGMLAGCGSGQSGNESPAGTTGEKETTAAESSKSETEGENMGKIGNHLNILSVVITSQFRQHQCKNHKKWK